MSGGESWPRQRVYFCLFIEKHFKKIKQNFQLEYFI